MNEKYKIKGWVARDKNNDLYLHWTKPEKIMRLNQFVAWRNPHDLMEPIQRLSSNLFPELTWESEPIEVELIIKKL